MSNLNLAQVIGRLGQDVKLAYLPSGSAVANFSVAVTDSWKDKASGERKENFTSDPRRVSGMRSSGKAPCAISTRNVTSHSGLL